MATGWAWDGTEAKKLGLVDTIGTYRDAMRKAAKLGGITGPYQTVTYGGTKLQDLLNGLVGLKQQLSPVGAFGSAGSAVQPQTTLAK